MALKVIPYKASDAAQWDQFCADKSNATFLHTRRYLSYHENNYVDLSLLIYSNNRLVGLFPIAISKKEGAIPISHPGISYGGIIHSGKLIGELMTEAFDLSVGHLRDLGYQKFVYKPIPYIYNSIPSQDDIYTLILRGAKVTRCNLSSSVKLSNRRILDSKRIRPQPILLADPNETESSKYSEYFLTSNFDKIGEFWEILTENLRKKYKSFPTHSLEEIITLNARFPDNIELITISNEQECLGGLILYWTENVCHIQYMSSSNLGNQVRAMDTLVEKAIFLGIKKGVSFLDFGHSNENFGKYLNSGLYKFKSKFGGGGLGLLEFTIEIK